jgi:hypothetical protein
MVDMPHYKTGEALVRWRVRDGWAWFVTDVAFNFTKVPPGIAGKVFKWMRSAPGFRRNAIAGMVMLKSKPALYAWLVKQAEKTPPALLLPSHGDPLTLTDPTRPSARRSPERRQRGISARSRWGAPLT